MAPRTATVAVLLLVLVAGAKARSLLATTSALWGTNGEDYKAGKDGRLLDYSYAGYMAGEEDIPDLKPSHNVKNYGAEGDGVKDDSLAFLRAIADMNDGDVLRIPAGKYVVSKSLQINKRISIKGDGSGDVEIIVPRLAGDALFVYDEELFGRRTLLTTVAPGAERGSNDITVRSSAYVDVGDWVAVTMGGPTAGKYFLEINMGFDRGCIDRAFCGVDVAYVHASRVAAVDGNTVTLERPLPWGIFRGYTPISLHALKPKIANIGIEGLSITMQSGRYLGHFMERSYNAIDIRGVANAWIRDIQMTDVDMGIQVEHSLFVTVTDIQFWCTEGRANSKGDVCGHHAITCSAWDILVEKFDLHAKWIHDLTVDKFAQGVVYSNGKGVDLNMDHHKAQNYGTLWTQLDFGKSRRPFNSGGRVGRGIDSGPLTTYWNLQGSSTFWTGDDLYPAFGPYLNFVGLPKSTPWPSLKKDMATTWFIEEIDGSDLEPANLYEAMKSLRLSSDNYVSAQLGGVGKGGKLLSSI